MNILFFIRSEPLVTFSSVHQLTFRLVSLLKELLQMVYNDLVNDSNYTAKTCVA